MSIFAGFDADNVEPAQPFTLLDEGVYEAVIETVIEKENSKKDGSFLEFVFTVISGPNEGRKLFERLNTKNPSRKAVDIANASFSSMLRALGVPRPVNEDDILNIPLILSVGIRKNKSSNPDWDGKLSNFITGYKPLNGQPAASVSAPVAPAKPVKAPWAKK